MSVDTFEAQVRELREAGLTPKLIARKLHVPMARVGPIVAAMAAQRSPSGEVVGCWVSPGWSRGLSITAGRDWPDRGGELDNTAGMIVVLIARRHRYDQVSVCGYVVDAYCLGVKNALGPHAMTAAALALFTQTYFQAYEGEPVSVPLDMAQHLVLGALEYAEQLGFRPHEDFAAAAGHLGDWSGPSALTFGCDGKPYYVEGPYDDPAAIIDTLNRSVGRGRFDYMAAWV